MAGTDYYDISEKEVAGDGSLIDRGGRLGYYHLGRLYQERLGVPIMLAETNMVGEEAADWGFSANGPM